MGLVGIGWYELTGNEINPDEFDKANRAKRSISNKQKTKSMKPKPGTAKPSGKIGKGGPATSPTDGRSLNVKKKGGKVKKGM